MKKNKIFFLIILIAAIFSLPTVSYAEECTEQQKQQIMSTINKEAYDSIRSAKNALSDYNLAVQDYENACGSKYPVQTKSTTTYGFSEAAIVDIVTINSADATTLVNEAQFAQTALDWSSVNPEDEECQDLAIVAEAAKEQLRKMMDATEIKLGIYRGDDMALSCHCNNAEESQECVNYAGQAKSVEDKSDDCELFTTYLKEYAMCPLCAVFKVILNTDNTIADIAWTAMAKSLQGVVLAFFMAYLAFNTLKVISSPGGADSGDYLKTVLGLGFKVVITYLMLNDSSTIYEYFIMPVIQGGLDMGMAMLGIVSSQAMSCLNDPVDYMPADGVISSSLLTSIYKTVDCFNRSAAIMPAVGKGLVCYSWATFIPDFSMWLIGLILYVFGIGLSFVIAFYLIDCTVQLGIVCALVPIMIACWPFKVTNQYSTKGVVVVMNTFFNFALMGVILALGMTVIGFAATGGEGGLEAYIGAINTNNIDLLEKLSALDGTKLFTLVSCCIFAFKLVGAVNSIADQFADGSGSKIGAGMGGAAASAMSGAAKSAGHMGGRALKSAGKAVAATPAGQAVGRAVNKAKGAALKGAATAGKKVGLGKFQNQNKSGPGGQGDQKGQGDGKGDGKGGGQGDTPNPQNNNQKPTGGGS